MKNPWKDRVDQETGEIVVTEHPKKPGEELRLKISDYASGKEMMAEIIRWSNS